MIFLTSFLFCGFVCLIGQIILDNTKLTPGHVTSLFVHSYQPIYEELNMWYDDFLKLPM